MTDRRTSDRIIWLLLAASFVVILNETIMGVALPTLMIDLSINAPTVQWVTTGFMLTMAVVIPMTGWLQERLRTTTVFTLAMTLFSIGTLIGAIAPSFPVLLGARIVQACGTAIMMPLLMTTILVLVPIENRGQMMGRISVVISLAPAIGPTASGFILQFFSWHFLFWFVLPIALVALVLGRIWMSDVNEPRAVPLDVTSVVLSAVGFGGLIYSLSQIGEGRTSVPTFGLLGVAIVALALFTLRQLSLVKQGRPFLDITAFRSRTFAISVGMLMISFGVLIGVFTIWPMFLQQVRQLPTLAIGLMMLPGGLAMGVAGPVVGRLFDRLGARRLVVPAAAVMAAMLVGMALVGPDTPVAVLVGLHLILSFALCFMTTPLFTGGLNALSPSNTATVLPSSARSNRSPARRGRRCSSRSWPVGRPRWRPAARTRCWRSTAVSTRRCGSRSCSASASLRLA